MIHVSSSGAETVLRADAGRRPVWLLSARRLRLAAAIMMVGGCLNISNIAIVEAASGDVVAQAPSCPEKCAKERADCLQAQSSEEMCTYDFKACNKACGG